ncbi:unnamed protein product [Larinioides sclopetarius]|uniref:Sushi domain-containing protein n=1 Tax=Larinioides sclopetarius TaxID=280406 RepID=A0AAV2A9R9_9ARAC
MRSVPKCQVKSNFKKNDIKRTYVICLHEDSLASWASVTHFSLQSYATALILFFSVKCADPPAVLNGSYTLESSENHPLTIRTKVIYSCDSGYHLDNFADSVLTCTLNWDYNEVFWNGTTPGCIFE